MSTPSAPTDATEDAPRDEVFLGPGAWGDVAKPELTRSEFIEQDKPEDEPCNPTVDSTPIIGPGGAMPGDESQLPPADSVPVQPPSTPATTADPAAPAVPAAPASS